MDYEVRPEQPVDRDDVLRVIAAAFGSQSDAHGQDVADIWAGLGRHRRTGLVVEQGGHVLGHVGLSRAWVDARRALVEVWVLSPLSRCPSDSARGSAPPWSPPRSDGTRERRTRRCSWRAARSYYGARGFERADRRGFLPAALERTPRAAFQCVLFEAHEGWMTGQLVYPDVWWQHDAAGLRDPALAELEERFAAIE